MVTAINGTTATIKTAKGKSAQVNLENPEHLDHALVSTVHSSQGATADRVLASLGSNLTTNAESFYVAASRVKYDLHLYVEDFAELLDRASFSRVQANPLELINEYSAATIETGQFNYERNTSQSKSKRNYSDQSQTSRETSQKPRIKPARIVKLAEYIGRFINEQGAESLEGNFRRLKQHLDERISPIGRTARLGNSVKQLDRTVTGYSHQRKRGEQSRKLNKIQNSIEELILSDDPKSMETARKIKLTLNNQPSKLNSLKKLQSTINQFEKHQQQGKLKNQVEKLVTSLANIQEQQELEALTQNLSRFNTQLQNYSFDKSSRIIRKLQLQKSIDERHHQQKAENEKVKFLEKPSREHSPPKVSQEQSASLYQVELRQDYLNAKQEVLKSQFSAPEGNLTFDVDLVKYLKSKSRSTSEIAATLAQSDHVHNLLQQHRHDLKHYRKQVAKYIFSVGTKAGITFDDYVEKNQSPYKQKKSAPEIEL